MNDIILSSINKDELVQLFISAHKAIIQKEKENEKESIKVDNSLGEYLTNNEVLKLCKVKSNSTLLSWRRKGFLVPAKRAGRKPLFLRKDVEDFLNGSFKTIKLY